MKKTKLTRSLMAAVSIVALSAVMYGCVHSGDDAVPADPPDLSMQIGGASAAAMAAATAASDAAAAVADVAGDSTADPASYIEARDAAAAAMAASDAAAEASDDAEAADTEEAADAALARAEAQQAAAEAALADAQMYAGMVTAAQEALDQAEADRIAAAEEAARIAAEEEAARIAAEEEAARIAAEEEAARIAAEEEAARIAAEEEAARIAAEEEAARIAAEEEAARIAAEEAAAAAAAELAALNMARTEADAAADAAYMSASDAAEAVAAVMADAGADQTSYDAAAAAAADAMTAARAARDASDAAGRATTSADAAMHQATAEAKQGEAATALQSAMDYAGMVTQAKADADEAQRIADEMAAAEAAAAMALADAKGEAQDAHDAAQTAKNAAQDAVDAVMDGMDLNVSTMAAFERAEAAADRANAAYLDAVTANVAAQAAMSADDADPHVKAAKAAQMAAETASAQAEVLAGIVQAAIDAKTAADAEAATEAAEATALADARKAANDAATAASTAATAADAAATEAETLLGATHPLAVKARAKANAADDAAGDAEEAASDAAADGVDSEQAVGFKMTAEDKQEDAEEHQADAVMYLAEAKLVHEHNQALAIDQAQAAAAFRAYWADRHAGAAVGQATTARTAADDAKDAANKAKSARTNYDAAMTARDEADTAARAAEQARDDAAEANRLAAIALQDANDATTLDDAVAARDEALKQEGLAYALWETARDNAAAARTAATAANNAANTHVVGLLRMANALHIVGSDQQGSEDISEATATARKAHVVAVNNAVEMANDDIDPANPTTGTPHHGGGTVTAGWHYYGDLGTGNAVGGTGDAADTKPGEGLPMISVTPEGGGGAVVLQHAGPGTDTVTGTIDDLIDNFVQGPGLGDFTHEKYISGLDTTTTAADLATNPNALNDFNTQRVILFTDLTQAKATVPARSFSLTNEAVSNAALVSPTEAPETTDADTLHDFDGSYTYTYTEDGETKTIDISGTFDCVDPTTCSVQRTGTGNNGEHVADQTEVVAISGYKFTGTGTRAEVPSALDDTWLSFGVWLTETVVDNATNTYAFGAFADGGAAIGDTDEPANTTLTAVTGDATYQGKAAGVHATATAVEFFHGDATLNAKFGDGTTDNGTITGMIHNIMAGGESVRDNIELLVSDPGAADPSPNIDPTATGFHFTGQARMTDTGEDDSSGEDIYRYTGGWSGSFYNHMADDPDTTPLDEATRAPGSVAGTFGVGRGDDTSTTMFDETESYVGAFGAHCSGTTNCNPHD